MKILVNKLTLTYVKIFKIKITKKVISFDIKIKKNKIVIDLGQSLKDKNFLQNENSNKCNN